MNNLTQISQIPQIFNILRNIGARALLACYRRDARIKEFF